MKYKTVYIFAGVLLCLVAVAVVMRHLRIPAKKGLVIWKEDFSKASRQGGSLLPEGWQLSKKPGTRPAIFSIVKDRSGDHSYLHMEAVKGSATLLSRLNGVDLNKTPILRWKWRAPVLPDGANGKIGAKDDQAIGIYVGTGTMLNKKSISYRWDTETPKGATGDSVYGGGTVKVKWYTLRNKEDAKNGQWIVEERNCAEDFKRAWGFYPRKIYLGISCNSQYTRTKAAADLDWVEFLSAADKGKSD